MTSVIPADSDLHRRLAEIATGKRIVVFAGLPGVGKSLLLQQLALIGHECGRRPHSFQWDVVRSSFETPELLAQYPEVDGFTHPDIIARVGTWMRGAIAEWNARYPGAEHMLIGEAALVGGRLMELTQSLADESESLLAGGDTLFVVPVPSREVRAVIEARRERTSSEPQHEREASDARPNVMRRLWEDAHSDAVRLGLAIPSTDHPIAYDPEVYTALYRHWLRHRHVEVLEIDTLYDVTGSVYDVRAMESELRFSRGQSC